jgi:hypothetical protein
LEPEAEAVEVVDVDANNQRVEVVHVATGRVVRGTTAPLTSSIESWLAANPGWRTRADVDASCERQRAADANVASTAAARVAAAEAHAPLGSQATDADATLRDGASKVRQRALSERDSAAALNKADPVSLASLARDGNGQLSSSPASSPRKRVATEALEDDSARPAASKAQSTGRTCGRSAPESRVLHSDAIGRVRAPRGGLDYATLLGARLLGERIDVWWGKEVSWFEGTVSKLDRASGCYTVEYDDGDTCARRPQPARGGNPRRHCARSRFAPALRAAHKPLSCACGARASLVPTYVCSLARPKRREEGLALPDRSVSFRALGPKPTGPPREFAPEVESERLMAKVVRGASRHGCTAPPGATPCARARRQVSCSCAPAHAPCSAAAPRPPRRRLDGARAHLPHWSGWLSGAPIYRPARGVAWLQPDLPRRSVRHAGRG